jgi:hypothetical protein
MTTLSIIMLGIDNNVRMFLFDVLLTLIDSL